MNDIDIVISATSSPHMVIRYDEMPKIQKKILMMDIALPRDIDPKINKLENIEIYDIDNLKDIQDKNDNKRKELAKIGSKMISEKIIEFIEWIDSIKIDPTIESLNDKCLEIREDTLDYIYRKTNLDNRDKKIIDKMLTSALKRLIREPIINLKQIKDKGKREEYIKLVSAYNRLNNSSLIGKYLYYLKKDNWIIDYENLCKFCKDFRLEQVEN